MHKLSVVAALAAGAVLVLPAPQSQAQQVAAAITKQITNLDSPTTGTIELTTLITGQARLDFVGLDIPAGLTLRATSPDNSQCPQTGDPSKCRQRWAWTIAANNNCTWNGQYKARYNLVCQPGAAGCTPRAHEVPFSLQSENFCAERTVDRLAKVEWEGMPGCVKDIAGAPNGSVWAIGCNANDHGFGVYQYQFAKNDWQGLPGGGTRLALDTAGYGWIVSNKKEILQWTSSGGRLVPGGCANDIAIGANGAVWVIGCKAVPGGFEIQNLGQGNKWQTYAGGAVRIAVDPSGTPWVANDAGNIFRWVNNSFQQVAGCAKDLAIGQDGVIWAIGCNAVPGGFGIYRMSPNGNQWENVPGGAVAISVSGKNQPWVANSEGKLFRAKAR